ncbi:MAG: 4Fe-4S dicluster domain-containing protein [Proteobacteria bacterium]|nr:4Fe-4S dicluster domain-containing protein [Pseudomonadota bacterium]
MSDIPWENLRQSNGKKMRRAGMVVDLRRCTGCHACSVSCKTEHNVPLGGFRTRVRYLDRERAAPQGTTIAYLPLLCMHCRDAPCMEACPTGAIVRKSDGRVDIDTVKCVADKGCVSACPYGAIYMDPQANVADKCDFCPERTAVGLDPACVSVCPADALRFGDLGDPGDPATHYAQKHNARVFRADAGTRPSVLYINHENWMEEKAKSIQLLPDDEDIIYEQK